MTKEHASQFDHNEEREILESIGASGHSYDPRGEKKRPAFERTSYQPKACSFNQIMELWAAHEGGALTRATHIPGAGGEGYGEDDAYRAWAWVASVPGWSPVVHEVMRHLVLRSKTWAEWPVGHVEKVTYCPWPPCCLPKETAGAAWVPFFRALRKQYRTDPFTICAQEAVLA